MTRSLYGMEKRFVEDILQTTEQMETMIYAG